MRVAAVVEPRIHLDAEAHLAAHAEHAPDQAVAVAPTAPVWIGMKSWISPTPPGVRKRVIRTFVSGKYSCFGVQPSAAGVIR